MTSATASPPPTVPFWRKDPPELDATGRITRGGMFAHQRRWWDLQNFVRLLVTGYGGGKSLSLCKRSIMLALENAPAPTAIVSPTFPMARETVIETCHELLEGKTRWLRGRFSYDFNKTSHVFRIAHRTKRYGIRQGRVIVYSGEHPERLKGPNLGAASIDEPFIQELAVFEQMVARVRHPRATRREINLGGTPEQLNWGWELVEGGLREDYDVGIVQASTQDNLALPPEYVERLQKAYDEKTAAAYLHGQFVNLASGLVYHAFDAERNVAEMAAPLHAEWGAGMDFNVNPMAFCVFWRANDHMHIVEEFELPNSDTEEACQILTERYGDRILDVYPDPSGRARKTSSPGGRTDFHHIRHAGYRVNSPPAAGPRRDRFNVVNGKLKHRTLTIAPSCKRLRRYLSTHSYELMNRQEGMSHLLDALGYPAVFLFPPIKRRVRQMGLGA